jgi:hypothetical protein
MNRKYSKIDKINFGHCKQHDSQTLFCCDSFPLNIQVDTVTPQELYSFIADVSDDEGTEFIKFTNGKEITVDTAWR